MMNGSPNPFPEPTGLPPKPPKQEKVLPVSAIRETEKVDSDVDEEFKVKESRVLWTKNPEVPADRVNKNSIKIFLLLLQPASKIFELIQLMYPAATTTIGKILEMIPHNATEPALGGQTYEGLARPKTSRDEFRDLEMIASDDKALVYAGIRRGEVLIAIPEGYTSKQVVQLGKQILSNPRIKRLIDRASSLPSSACSTSTGSTSSSTKRRSRKKKSKKFPLAMTTAPKRESVRVMDVLEEESQEEASPRKPKERKQEVVKPLLSESKDNDSCDEVLKRAVEHAAVANAEVSKTAPGQGRYSVNKEPSDIEEYLMNRYPSLRRQLVLQSYDSDNEKDDMASMCLTNEDTCTTVTLYDSSQASPCFVSHKDTEHLSGFTLSARSPSIVSRRQKAKARITRKLRELAMILAFIMVVRYFVDPRGFSSRGVARGPSCPLGLTGLIQCCFFLAVFWKSQLMALRLKSQRGRVFLPGSPYTHHEMCPFMHTASALLCSE
jgi:hypothetical protein